MLLTSHNLKSYLLHQVSLVRTSHNAFQQEVTTSVQTVQDSSAESEEQILLEESSQKWEAKAVNWTTQDVHYLKLGETHAFLCIFKKELVELEAEPMGENNK